MKPYLPCLAALLALAANAHAEGWDLADPALLAAVERRIPGQEPPLRVEPPVINPDGLPPPPLEGEALAPVPDRWRITDALGIGESRLDPYNRNLLKADRPLFGDWFFNLSVISDTLLEFRRIPTQVGPQAGNRGGALDQFGDQDAYIFNQNLIVGFVLYEGDTVFRPPDYELRFTPVLNYNRVEVEEVRLLHIDPGRGDSREDNVFAVQELFVDKHLRNVSERYDFDSIRLGIQPFNADFRGFLFQDQQLGVRLFGNRDNNRWQYNLAWFRRVDKDTNSGLNDLSQELRDDDVFIANLYRQDFPVLGFTSQATVVHNRNDETDFRFDENGFLVRPASLGLERPREYEVTYLGLNGDGHIRRLNLTGSLYYAFGSESVGVFADRETDISAWFAAAEASVDVDWLRLRLSGLYASGDDDPFDGDARGFDAVFENPQFAGADASLWIRQPIPNIGGGGVALSGRNAVLASLRSSKEQGQSNFANPGLRLLGVGADADLTPQLRLSADVNKLWFDDAAVLEVARNQGGIDRDIGWDVSVAVNYRPLFSQNIVLRAAFATLFPGDGYEDLFGDEQQYSVLANLLLTF